MATRLERVFACVVASFDLPMKSHASVADHHVCFYVNAIRVFAQDYVEQRRGA